MNSKIQKKNSEITYGPYDMGKVVPKISKINCPVFSDAGTSLKITWNFLAYALEYLNLKMKNLLHCNIGKKVKLCLNLLNLA